MKQCSILVNTLVLVFIALPNYCHTQGIPSPAQTTQQQLNFFRRTIVKCVHLYERYKKYRANQYSPEEKKQFEEELRSLRNKLLIVGSTFVVAPTIIMYVHYVSTNVNAAKNSGKTPEQKDSQSATSEEIKRKLHELEKRSREIEKIVQNDKQEIPQEQPSLIQQYKQQLHYLHEKKIEIFKAIANKYHQQRLGINIEKDTFDKLDSLEAEYQRELKYLDLAIQNEQNKINAEYLSKLPQLKKTPL